MPRTTSRAIFKLTCRPGIHAKIEFMIGTNLVTVADGIEVEPARLFMRLFSDDTRRYWARHN